MAKLVRPKLTKWRALSAVVAMVGAAAVSVVASAPASHAIAPGLTGYHVVAGSTLNIDGPSTPLPFSVDESIGCPAGQTAISGGIDAHSPLVQIVSMYPFTSSGAISWEFTVTQTVHLGYTQAVTPEVVCVDATSVPGLTIAGHSPATVAGGGANIVDTFCPSADYVLGGGFSNSENSGFGTISRPLDGQTWQAAAFYPGTGTETLTAYATCVPQTAISDYTQTFGDSSSFGATFDQTAGVPAGDLYGTTGSPYCPNGDLASGGGVVNHDWSSGNAWVSSLIAEPGGDPHYWLETSNDASPPSYGEWAAANAVCVNGTLAPIATTTTLSINPTHPGLNQLVTLTATVTPASGSTPPSGTVEFYDNGVLIGTGTLSGGVATMTYRFGAGSHSLVAKYLGDTTVTPNFLPSQSDPVTFTIACTTTITGTHGAFTASSGLTCVTDANITGGVTVVNGAQLDVENSTIHGGVTLSSSGAVRMCGSTLSSLTVAAAKGYVMIGDPNSACDGNTIKGGVTIASNKGGGSLINNTITGATSVSGNTPAWTVSGNHS